MINLGKTICLNIIIDTNNNIENYDYLNNLLENITIECNLNVLSTNYHKFEPQGLTICKILSESHITIHTCPEFNSFALDVYSCNTNINETNILKIIDKYFVIKYFTYSINDRIIHNPNICNDVE
jgi:S-adenosylmethionine decarboxylase proenzyme